jgi:uncharacterized protein YgbK (DUF1537 family)
VADADGPLRATGGIVADDLTGACDTAVAFVRGGWRAAVLFAGGAGNLGGVDFAAMSTDTRELGADEAYWRTREAFRNLRALGYLPFYKKLDSVLRGNVGAELAAALAEGEYPFALVAPAFPAMGRTLRGGRLCVHGEPGPALPGLLDSDGLTGVVLIGASSDADGLARQIGQHRTNGARVLVADADTDEHLRALAMAVLPFPDALLAGSGGLAAQVAGLYGEAGPVSAEARSVDTAVLPGGRGVLFVVGTPHPVTRAQVEALHAAGRTECFGIDPPEQGVAIASLEGGRDVLLPLYEPDAVPHCLAALPVLARRARAVVVTGGETAARVFGMLSADVVHLRGVIETGFPWGVAAGAGEPLTVAMKSGGFGGPSALRAASDFLRDLPRKAN